MLYAAGEALPVNCVFAGSVASVMAASCRRVNVPGAAAPAASSNVGLLVVASTAAVALPPSLPARSEMLSAVSVTAAPKPRLPDPSLPDAMLIAAAPESMFAPTVTAPE